MFKYQELIDLLPAEKVNAAIKRMADCYDLTGNFFEKEDNRVYYVLNGERLLKNYFELSSEFISLLDNYAQKEYDEELSDDLTYFASIDTPENQIEYQKERISLSIIDYLKAKARKILDNREFLRIPVGKTVDFNECMLSNKYLGKVEFYKDGGWGIAEEDGTVLVKNHLTKQPSKTYSLYCGFSHINTPYQIIQDRDTNKYGIISFESFYETVHCLYDKIEIIDYYDDSTRHFFIKAMKNGKWGCFDERCALIIDFEYEIIELISGYLECIKEAEYLLNESLSDKDKKYVTEGKRDLYDNEGKLLIGGYDNLFVDYGYLKFYFGSSYEYYEDEENDFQGYPVPLSKVRFNSQNSKCLILDKEFKTIISNGNGLFRMPKGHKFNSLDEVEEFVPSGYLLSNSVDLTDFNEGFIYLYNYHGEQYLIPDYIQEGFASPEDRYKFNVLQRKAYNDHIKKLQNLFGEVNKESNIEKPFDYSETTEVIYKVNNDMYVDDSVITILLLNERKEIVWKGYANEIEKSEYFTHIYRKGKKFGVFDVNGLKPAFYDAITRESPDYKLYFASFEYCRDPNPIYNDNPNYIDYRHMYIHYYTLEDGNYIRLEDDWNIFNPRKCKWFPYDFITINYGDCDGRSYDSFSDRGHEWTDEDAWDAMTDGMYGDYPGPGWDPESFGY